jgi:hypothetical protein
MSFYKESRYEFRRFTHLASRVVARTDRWSQRQAASAKSTLTLILAGRNDFFSNLLDLTSI